MAFDYRQFLAENKLTKVSKGRENGKAQILSEGIQIREGFDTPDMEMDEANQGNFIGEYTSETYNELVDKVKAADGDCSFKLNGKTFTIKPEDRPVGRYYRAFENDDYDLTNGTSIEQVCHMLKMYSEDRISQMAVYEETEMDEANKQKEDYLKRKEREKRGNWKGSIGAFVEEHGEELGNMIGKNRQQLKDYVENVMKPELTPEAKSKVDELLDSKKSTFGFIQSLYNFHLAGVGLKTDAGSLRETATCDECDNWDETEEVAWEDNGAEYPVDDEDEEREMRELNEATEQKYKGTPQEKGSRMGSKGYKGKKTGDAQDRMAKSEMTGEKLDITIGGVTKTISKQAWSRYRKMTDPEEKKAWKQRHGFIKESKTLKEGKEGGDQAIIDALRMVYNYFKEFAEDGEFRQGLTITFDGDDAPGFAVAVDNGELATIGRFPIM